MKHRGSLAAIIVVLALLVSLGIGVGGASSAMDELGAEAAMGTAFTYQGQLKDAGGPVSATCDLQFTLWDASAGGAQVGSPVVLENVLLQDGLFTARLDFGAAAFQGQARYLEVAASCPAGSAYVTLARQELTGSPYALYALAVPWTGLKGVPGGFADGVDNDTTYTAGAGLVLEGTEFRANRAETQWRVSDICAAGSSIRAIDVDGTVTCEADDNTTYTAGAGLSLLGGQFSVSFAGTGSAGTASRSDHNHDAAYVNEGQANSVSTGMVQNSTLLLEDLNQNGCSLGQVIKWNGSAWACAADATGATSFWSLTGNAGTVPGTNYLGTSDNAALEIRVNNTRALRIEPSGEAPNLIGGWWENYVDAGVVGAAIGGGGSGEWGENRVGDDFGTVGGGQGNTASGRSSVVGGGELNTASYAVTTVGGGQNNTTSYAYATVGGGESNTASGWAATIGGGQKNTASGELTTIGGGGSLHWPEYGNRATDDYGTVGGGFNNQAGDNAGDTSDRPYATVGGGRHNDASGDSATVGGGGFNTASGLEATVGGGSENTAGGMHTTVGGGSYNTASDGYGTVAGGFNNQAGDDAGTPDDRLFATVGGGRDNVASGTSAVVAGGDTNTASGDRSTVPGGVGNVAAGHHSFAAGRRAKALHDGAFVWADAHDADFASTAANQFLVRAYNGVKIVRGASTFSDTQAALQVEQGAAAEAAWLYAAHADNAYAVLKVVKQPAAPGNFIEGTDWIGTGAETRRFHIDRNGTYVAGSDFAEALPVAGDPAGYEPGDVLVISLEQPGGVEKCRYPYDSLVVGVYSTRPGFLGADKDGTTEVAADEVPVAVLGIVPVKVTDENGPIQPGDLLTTSSTAGHAMRCQGLELCFGRTLGKALEGLPAGEHSGVIQMLVSLQ